eukprot:Opistho-1_new@28218
MRRTPLTSRPGMRKLAGVAKPVGGGAGTGATPAAASWGGDAAPTTGAGWLSCADCRAICASSCSIRSCCSARRRSSASRRLSWACAGSVATTAVAARRMNRIRIDLPPCARLSALEPEQGAGDDHRHQPQADRDREDAADNAAGLAGVDREERAHERARRLGLRDRKGAAHRAAIGVDQHDAVAIGPADLARRAHTDPVGGVVALG